MNEEHSPEITWHDGEVRRTDRSRILSQRGATIWFTGLSGSGKSTIAVQVEKQLVTAGHLAYRLDGDNVRHGLCADLGFSASDRSENIRRIGHCARLMADAGMIVLASFISPYAGDRDRVREMHEADGLAFVEVHVDVPIEVAESRDPKGLYRRARAGEITGFTGIDAPYEAPGSPEIHLHAAEMDVEACGQDVLAHLEAAGILG